MSSEAQQKQEQYCAAHKTLIYIKGAKLDKPKRLDDKTRVAPAPVWTGLGVALTPVLV